MTSIARLALEFDGGDPWARVAAQVRTWSDRNAIALRDAIVAHRQRDGCTTRQAIGHCSLAGLIRFWIDDAIDKLCSLPAGTVLERLQVIDLAIHA